MILGLSLKPLNDHYLHFVTFSYINRTAFYVFIILCIPTHAVKRWVVCWFKACSHSSTWLFRILADASEVWISNNASRQYLQMKIYHVQNHSLSCPNFNIQAHRVFRFNQSHSLVSTDEERKDLMWRWLTFCLSKTFADQWESALVTWCDSRDLRPVLQSLFHIRYSAYLPVISLH